MQTRVFLKYFVRACRSYLRKKVVFKDLVKKRGRPLMLVILDEKVKTFFHVLGRKGVVLNTIFAVATTNTLIARSPDEHLKCLDLDSSYWA